MPNLSYMLVNFVYLATMSAWVGGSLGALIMLRVVDAARQSAASHLSRLLVIQALSAMFAGVASAVKAVIWEDTGWLFSARYVCLAGMGLAALWGVWRLLPILFQEDVHRGTAVVRALRLQGVSLALGLVALFLS